MKKKTGTLSTPGYERIVNNRFMYKEVLFALNPAKVAQIESASINNIRAFPKELL